MIISSRNLKDQGRTWNYGAAESITIAGDKTWPTELTEKLGQFGFDQPYVTEIENVSICGPIGVGIKGKDIFLDTAYSGRLDVLERNRPYMQWSFQSKRLKPILLDTAVSMVGVWSGNYFHWLLEFFARFEAVEVYEKETGFKPLVVLEADPPKFVLDTLKMCDYKYVTLSHPHFSVNKLVVPTFRRDKGRVAPGVITYLRTKFGVETALGEVSNLWISRENASERRVRNAKEVIGDREKIYNEILSFELQMKQYNRAYKITGPHGAGFTNMIWANPGVAITELFGSYINPCFMTLAAACGHKYTPVFCEPVGKDMKCESLPA